jgi:hypothetical protein
VSECRTNGPQCCDHREHHDVIKQDRPCEHRAQRRFGTREKRSQWTPRSDYHCGQDGCQKIYTEERRHDYNYGYGGPSVECKTRRYRLYARPAYGWRGSCDSTHLQYAVKEESISRHDAIFVVLPDDPRQCERNYHDRAHRFGAQRFQPLESYEHIWVPGECSPFTVHLYADEWHH